VAAVADLHVALAGEHPVGGIGRHPHRVAAVHAGHERLHPRVRVDLGRVGGLVVGRRREQVARHVAGGDPVAAHDQQREMGEVLADARAGVQQVVDGGADVGHAGAVLEAVGDDLDQPPQRRQRGLGAHQPDHLVDRDVVGVVGVGKPELAGHLLVGRLLERRPFGLGRLGRLGRHDPRADVDRQLLVRLGDAELDHRRAVVVLMLVQAHLGGDADAEVVDLLRRRRRRLDAQRVEVVGDRPVVAVLGQVADGEVHQAVSRVARRGIGGAAPPKYRWAISTSTCASSCCTLSSVAARPGS
jgi:hypothetical protein